MKRKIAIIADGWRRHITYVWIRGCRNYIKEHELDIEISVFHSFGNFSRDEKFNAGEYNIIHLPDLSQFDGIILEVTNMLNQKKKQQIIRIIQESGVPAVSLLEKIPGLYHAGLDNYATMEQMVEHLIVAHSCKTLNYVGGPADSQENLLRWQAYEDVLQRYGIPLENDRIWNESYEVESGVRAFIHFQEKHLLPDAFVCANENIAVGLCHQAQQEGFKIPADFCVTGFDNFDKASYYRPRITTVSYEREVIAEAAMDLLVQIWGQNTTADCKTVPVQMLFQDSCGCKPEQVRNRSEYIEDRIFQEVREIDLHNEIMELKHNLIECEDYKQMAQYFTKCVCGLRCKGVRIWMNQDLVEESLSDSMGEASYITDGYPDTMHVICEKGMEQEYSLYVYAPLHFREREVGYVVLADCDYMLENQFLFETMNTYLESLEYLYRKLRLRKANEKLSRLYVLDSLTGLYNRMAYQEFAEPLYEKCRLQKKPVTVMFIDADHLKYINDTFGHDMGNLEIRGIADGIRKVFPPEAVSMRYGGDEFVVLLPGCEKAQAESLKAAFLKALDEISKSLHAEFDVEASIGYEVVLCGEKSLNECINNADEKMYQFKKARKAQRK